MNQSCCQKRIWLGLFGVLAINSAIADSSNCVLAQIVPDNTLGNESSTTQIVPQRPLDVISGGATRGANLFHSFSEFNIGEGRGAYFFSPSADIQNILARVTGGNPSIILGIIGTYGNSVPNLFLVNPSGIIFGPNAILDIGNSGGLNNFGGTGGSFVATTADAVLLGNSGIFSASNPAASNLLTVNPSALFFNGTSTAGIVNRSFGLIVPYGRSLLLVGDNVRLDSAGLLASDGRVELGAVAAGTVGLNIDSNNISLDYPTQVQRADVVITNNSLVSVAGSSGGNLIINARNIDILEQSTLLGGAFPQGTPIRAILPQVSSDGARAGDITLNATGAIAIAGKDNSFASSSTIFNNLNSGGVEQGGSINITADSLSLNGAGITTINNGQGNAGSIFIQAKNSAAFVDSKISSRLTEEASGKAGDIDIQAQSIFFNSSSLDTNTSGRGDAGNVSIRAGSLSLENKSTLITNVLAGGVGKGGNINIQARSFSLTNESTLNTITAGRGDAGSVFIQATDFVSLVYSDIFTNNLGNLGEGEVAVGNSGSIQILTGSLFLDNNSTLSTITSGFGDAGNISIRTSGSTSLTGSNIVSSVFNSALSGVVGANVVGQGKSGDISIEADSLKLDNTTLITSTAGQGDAGAILVRANNISLTSNSQINSAVGQGGVGDAGDIELDARSLLVTGGSQIRASVGRPNNNLPGGQGAGGNIRINASDGVELSGVSTNGASSALSTSTNRGASGQAGNITVNTTNFRIADGAVVSALTANSSNAGNITINANNFEATGGGQVLTSTSSSGRAGTITLNVTNKIALSGTDPTFATRLAQFGTDIVTNQGSASGLFANTAPGSTGVGGSIFIDPIEFNISDGAGVSVSSQGQGNAGNLEVRAGTITLDRGGFLSASTASGEGGNIDIRAQDLLLLRRNSNISSNAGGSGNGGNINLDTTLLVALPLEDSNIIADAVAGRGGNISISTQGIFGIQSRPAQTSFSDITASSELGIDGTVDLNTPDVDPAQGLVTLPVDTVDTSNQIASGCTNSNNSASSNKFNVTGRGGLPPNPSDNLTNDAVLTDWATLEEKSPNNSNPNLSRQKSPAQPIVEAQGWVINPQGKVILTAQAPNVTPNSNKLSSSSCRNS